MAKFVCNQCGEEKDTDEFRPDSRLARGHQAKCIECQRQNASSQFKERKSTPEIAKQMRDSRLLKEYGVTASEYDKMVKDQEGKCKICGRLCERLEVDHDHRTHVVRGLLCNPCNQALGLFQDNPLILEAAAKYLREDRPPPELFAILSMFGRVTRRRKK